jgi:Ribbon-helix-helix protein, copG family
MSKFPKQFGPDVEVREVDLDREEVRFRGDRLTEARAEAVAEEVRSRTPGRPSLSGVSEKSPSLTIRLPKQERARLDRLAAEQGRRTSQVVREALDDYLARHTG